MALKDWKKSDGAFSKANNYNQGVEWNKGKLALFVTKEETHFMGIEKQSIHVVVNRYDEKTGNPIVIFEKYAKSIAEALTIAKSYMGSH